MSKTGETMNKLIAFAKETAETMAYRVASVSPTATLSWWIAWLMLALQESQQETEQVRQERSEQWAKRKAAESRLGKVIEERDMSERLRAVEMSTAKRLRRERDEAREACSEALRAASEAEAAGAVVVSSLVAVSDTLTQVYETGWRAVVARNAARLLTQEATKRRDEVRRDMVDLRARLTNSETDSAAAWGIISSIRREAKCPENSDLICWVADRVAERDKFGKQLTEMVFERDAEKTRADAAEHSRDKCYDELLDRHAQLAAEKSRAEAAEAAYQTAMNERFIGTKDEPDSLVAQACAWCLKLHTDGIVGPFDETMSGRRLPLCGACSPMYDVSFNTSDLQVRVDFRARCHVSRQALSADLSAECPVCLSFGADECDMTVSEAAKTSVDEAWAKHTADCAKWAAEYRAAATKVAS